MNQHFDQRRLQSYEGWELKWHEADDAEPLFAAMSAALPAETIDLSRPGAGQMCCILFTETVLVAVKTFRQRLRV